MRQGPVVRAAELPLLAALELLAGCSASHGDIASGLLVLPAELREVSGIVAVDDDTIACVQDEKGAIYFVDLHGRRPPRAVRFGKSGDYEGLARVGDEYWALRSDGVLVHLVPEGSGFHVQGTHRLMTEHHEFEGVCYDAPNNQLLVLPKDVVGNDKELRDERPIFGFDLATKQLRATPVLIVSAKELVQEAALRGIDLPTRTSAKGKVHAALKLHCSELSTMPGSADLLLLSSVDGVLLRVDRTGRLLGARILDRKELPQPEGLAFLADGRLLVASEGVGGAGVVRVVDWR